MTTTELAVIEDDAEVVETQPLTKAEAKKLDKQIRSASDKLSTQTDNLLDLLERAAAGQIHVALELPSWTAWFKDAVQIQISDRFERKELVKLMSGKGMSQRAIAGSLGVSQKTVDRDLEGEEFESDTVVSLDGVERPRNGAVKDDEPVDVSNVIEGEFIDAEVVDAPIPAAEIVDTFNDETANLWNAFSEMNDLTGESKWQGARKRIAKANLNTVQEVITGLQAIVDDLMVGEG